MRKLVPLTSEVRNKSLHYRVVRLPKEIGVTKVILKRRHKIRNGSDVLKKQFGIHVLISIQVQIRIDSQIVRKKFTPKCSVSSICFKC